MQKVSWWVGGLNFVFRFFKNIFVGHCFLCFSDDLSCIQGGFEAEDAEGGWEAGKADGTPR